MDYLLAIDLETTGLNPDFHEIMQIGAYILDSNLNIIGTFDSFINIIYPERGIIKDFNVFEYTNINIENLKKSENIDIVLNKFINFVKLKTKLKDNELKNITIFGQNSKFDYDFLINAFKINHIEFPFDYHIINLESIYFIYHLIKYKNFPKQIRFKDISNEFKIINPQAHNAIGDIITTIGLLKSIRNNIKIEEIN